jgi:hypothetical protein
VTRARRDGRIETDVPLMSIPAYTRARALAVRLRATMPKNDFQALCLYNAESNAILKAMDSLGDKLDPKSMKMYLSVVPERGVSSENMAAALATLNDLVGRSGSNKQKKPWWKFW